MKFISSTCTQVSFSFSLYIYVRVFLRVKLFVYNVVIGRSICKMNIYRTVILGRGTIRRQGCSITRAASGVDASDIDLSWIAWPKNLTSRKKTTWPICGPNLGRIFITCYKNWVGAWDFLKLKPNPNWQENYKFFLHILLDLTSLHLTTCQAGSGLRNPARRSGWVQAEEKRTPDIFISTRQNNQI